MSMILKTIRNILPGLSQITEGSIFSGSILLMLSALSVLHPLIVVEMLPIEIPCDNGICHPEGALAYLPTFIISALTYALLVVLSYKLKKD